ncbi:MAG: twin-arginine translocase TatA/TatE family subunit [Solirubrobacterales bacterium]|nr:twin-arginine translocase TatA/TatE family subunit [Solirubrobacterales bacterium]
MIGDIFQPTHLLFLLVIVLLVLGPKRLPEVARSLGRGFRDFKDAISGEGNSPMSEFKDAMIGDSHPTLSESPEQSAAPSPPAAEPAAVAEPEPVATPASKDPGEATG